MNRARRVVAAVGVAVALAVGTMLAVAAVKRAFLDGLDRLARSSNIPFCPAFARGRIGADWATRRALAGDPIRGEIEDFAVYDRAVDADRTGFDASDVHPEVRRFYERTAEYELAYETTWHCGFRTGARLAALVTSRLEQLNLPGRSDGRVRRLESEFAAVDPAVDPRGESRVWTRTDPETGSAVFVAIYTTHEREGVTYANVAVPLPWSNLSTVLRPEHLRASNDSGANGVRFTTRRSNTGSNATLDPNPDSDSDDSGLYLVTPKGALTLPMEQSFQVWPVGAPGAPRAPTADATLVADHEMWIGGRQFLTIRYGIVRSERR